MARAIAPLLAAWLAWAPATQAADPYLEGIRARLAGNFNQAVQILSAARAEAQSAHARARASGELGVAYLQLGRVGEAREMLAQAVADLSGAERARYTLDLARVAAQLGNPEEAADLLREAKALAPGNERIGLIADLNLARLAPKEERLDLLAKAASRIPRIAHMQSRAMLHLNAGSQAQGLGPAALQLAYTQLQAARNAAELAADDRLRVEALDALAGLYASNGRARDAITLSREALSIARAADPGRTADLLIDLEWRVGRLAREQGDADLALAAYQRAVADIDAVRADIPIQYEDGRSSYRATLEPIYLGYADLLFGRLEGLRGAEQQAVLGRIRDVVELTRQAELQDYLRDRCDVDAIQRTSRSAVGPGVAVLYPIVFADRIELLLETDAGIAWRTTRVDARTVRLTAGGFARTLRAGADGYMVESRALHRWLLQPFESVFEEQRTSTLIVVPEGSLRLVPMHALHDGKRYAIERFAIGTVTGLTMTNASPRASGEPETLVAGMSIPGPVVDRLPSGIVESIAGTRGGQAVSRDALRETLSLPGVKEEVMSVARLTGGRMMLDEAFTARAFQGEAGSGDYRIVHIASHGVFGGSADTSFIMAYDDVLSMRDLQSLLHGERFRRKPMELLTLSACQSAEGDDRSPLGISGAAVKARAKSVLGTLWPVEDDAARTVMERFYRLLAGGAASKVKALQAAQVETMRERRFEHPFFWAPFVLIGNWQ